MAERPGVRDVLRRVQGKLQRWLDPSQEELWRSGVISMGRGSYGTPRVVYHEGDTAKVTIGRYCSIAGGVEIMPGGNHRIDWVSTFPFRVRYGLEGALDDGHPSTKGDVVIGSDVWIGSGALILSGITISDGAVVAARSVVTKNVEPYTVVAGNPARVVAQRFSAEQRRRLLALRWWDWPEQVVLERVVALNGGDVDAFLDQFSPSPG